MATGLRRLAAARRPEVLEGAPMRYAPENELGVVFLFAYLARRWRLRIDRIRSGYPDCIAYQRVRSGEKQIRVEFEFKSRSFAAHRHPPRYCDWLVCWEHNWPNPPSHLRIVELRREFGLGFNVWIMPVKDPYKKEMSRTVRGTWSVPSQAHQGDLVLYYFTHPEMAISYIYRLKERSRKRRAYWKPGMDYMASITRLATLKAPLFLEDLARHRVLQTASFVRGKMQGRPNATEYWPYLYDLILRRNPALRSPLSAYSPELLM